jgi:hypothetical protein
MAIDDDLIFISKAQESFKKTHGAYFEMDWAEHNIAMPLVGDELTLNKVKRFIGNDPLGNTFPSAEVKEIPFTPSAKDWRFCIGRGIQRDGSGNVLKECWYCQAVQKDTKGIVSHKFIGGGDLDLLEPEAGGSVNGR